MKNKELSRREREKLRQRQEILDEAMVLFSERGDHRVVAGLDNELRKKYYQILDTKKGSRQEGPRRGAGMLFAHFRCMGPAA